jgi:hypothetical protein
MKASRSGSVLGQSVHPTSSAGSRHAVRRQGRPLGDLEQLTAAAGPGHPARFHLLRTERGLTRPSTAGRSVATLSPREACQLMLEEETQHLPGRVRPARIRVGPGRTAS